MKPVAEEKPSKEYNFKKRGRNCEKALEKTTGVRGWEGGLISHNPNGVAHRFSLEENEAIVQIWKNGKAQVIVNNVCLAHLEMDPKTGETPLKECEVEG